jgi:AraC-like DNA-binding protein
MPKPAGMLPKAPKATQMDALLGANRLRMVQLLKKLTTEEGLRPSNLEGVLLARVDRSHGRMAILYEPNIYIVANGRKKGFVGQRQFVYDSNNYLVLSIPLPFDCETTIANGDPMLAVSVRVDLQVLSELSVQMGIPKLQRPSEEVNGIAPTALDAELSAATVRLLECLRSPQEAAILGPGRVREVMYRVLCGPQAEVLLAMLGRNGQLASIHAALHRMHTRYFEPMDVRKLAQEIGMSVSAFHQHFKQVTDTSPLQYIKAVRLHKARLLIMHDGLGAAEAALKVGYESSTQFHREFKRFFGHTPKQVGVAACPTR